mmetsp:Transcript_25587/g.19360  ORF Transcript_25587/g.19360 Transcript_25587/m.19360 type:complete len:93 (+) Transcript_25587:645-923(+)
MQGFLLHYHLFTRPFTEPKYNKLEAFNDLIILLVAYCVLDFSDAELDPHKKFNTGWVVFALMAVAILVNLWFLVSNQFIIIYGHIKRYQLKR